MLVVIVMNGFSLFTMCSAYAPFIRTTHIYQVPGTVLDSGETMVNKAGRFQADRAHTSNTMN